MSIKERGNTWLIRIYLGRDKATGKRLEYNETVRGSVEEAAARHEELQEKLASGTLLVPSKMTVEELNEHHCKVVRNEVSPRHLFDLRARFDLNVKNIIGHIAIGDVTGEHIKKVIDTLLDRGLSPNTVRGVYASVKAVFMRAAKDKLISECPFKGVKMPKANPTEVTYLAYDEAVRFDSVKWLYWYGSAFVFQLHTGLRNQELLALRWEDVDFERATLHVRRACVWINAGFKKYGPPKTRKSKRLIPLDGEHIRLLKTHRENQKTWVEGRRRQGLPYYDEGLIFATRDGRTPAMSIPRHTFRAMLRRAGINRKIRWYDLRHTYATYMIDMGCNLIYLAKLMGTSVKLLEDTYVHVIADRQREVAAAFVKQVPISMTQKNTEGKTPETLEQTEELPTNEDDQPE